MQLVLGEFTLVRSMLKVSSMKLCQWSNIADMIFHQKFSVLLFLCNSRFMDAYSSSVVFRVRFFCFSSTGSGASTTAVDVDWNR